MRVINWIVVIGWTVVLASLAICSPGCGEEEYYRPRFDGGANGDSAMPD